MRHEKVFKREDGSRVKVEVSIRTEWYQDRHEWVFSVWLCHPGKRTWHSVVDHDLYSWRKMSTEERKADDVKKYLSVATADEVLLTMLELWDKMKPERIVT